MSRFCSGFQSAEPVVRKLGADGVGSTISGTFGVEQTLERTTTYDNFITGTAWMIGLDDLRDRSGRGIAAASNHHVPAHRPHRRRVLCRKRRIASGCCWIET